MSNQNATKRYVIVRALLSKNIIQTYIRVRQISHKKEPPEEEVDIRVRKFEPTNPHKYVSPTPLTLFPHKIKFTHHSHSFFLHQSSRPDHILLIQDDAHYISRTCGCCLAQRGCVRSDGLEILTYDESPSDGGL
jgi:hypothetical protein